LVRERAETRLAQLGSAIDQAQIAHGRRLLESQIGLMPFWYSRAKWLIGGAAGKLADRVGEARERHRHIWRGQRQISRPSRQRRPAGLWRARQRRGRGRRTLNRSSAAHSRRA
jgi:hypothetical protein